jgi:hypothetical protein
MMRSNSPLQRSASLQEDVNVRVFLIDSLHPSGVLTSPHLPGNPKFFLEHSTNTDTHIYIYISTHPYKYKTSSPTERIINCKYNNYIKSKI